ncbi:jg21610, partial [Pararge aegeria aegeria]
LLLGFRLREWVSDLERVTKLDGQLWELVSRHRVRRPLPPVRRPCPQGCKPVTIHIAKDEWCISTGAEQGIQENRRSARAAIRQLSRPRPLEAQVTSRLHSIGRSVLIEKFAY